MFYDTEWMQGGGENSLGSGRDVRVKVYDSDGRLRHSTLISVGQRDGWPVGHASRLALPLGDGGALLLQVAPGSLTVTGRSPSRPRLSESGVVGRFTGTNELTLISLDRIGLTRHRLNFAEPEPVAACPLPPAAME